MQEENPENDPSASPYTSAKTLKKNDELIKNIHKLNELMQARSSAQAESNELKNDALHNQEKFSDIEFNNLTNKIKRNRENVDISSANLLPMDEDQLVKVCFYLKNNTKFQQDDYLSYDNFSFKQKFFVIFINKIQKRNEQINIIESSQKALKENFLIKNISKKFGKFFLKCLAEIPYIFSIILILPALLGIISHFFSKIPSPISKKISLPLFRFDKNQVNISIDKEEFLVTPFNAIFVVLFFLSVNIGQLAGALVALPISFLLSPFLLIKSFYDNYQEKKEMKLKINNHLKTKGNIEKKIELTYGINNIDSKFYKLNFEELIELNGRSIESAEDIKKIYAKFEEICLELKLASENQNELEEFIKGAIAFFESIKKKTEGEEDLTYGEAQLALYNILEQHTSTDKNTFDKNTLNIHLEEAAKNGSNEAQFRLNNFALEENRRKERKERKENFYKKFYRKDNFANNESKLNSQDRQPDIQSLLFPLRSAYIKNLIWEEPNKKFSQNNESNAILIEESENCSSSSNPSSLFNSS